MDPDGVHGPALAQSRVDDEQLGSNPFGCKTLVFSSEVPLAQADIEQAPQSAIRLYIKDSLSVANY